MQIFENVLTDLGYPIIQDWLKINCQSDGAKILVNQLQTYTNNELVNELDLTQEILDSLNRKESTLKIKFPIINVWIELLTIKGSRLSNDQFYALYNLLIISQEIKTKCIIDHFPKWNNTLKNIFLFKSGQEAIKKIFDDTFNIKDSASSELTKIRKSISQIKNQNQKKLNSIFIKAKSNNWLTNDQLIWKDDRLMIPVDVTHKRKINGVIHSYSSTKQTAFIEPIDIIEDNNKLTVLYQDEIKEINSILFELTAFFHPYINEIKHNNMLIINFDFHTSKALFSKTYNCCRPHFNQKNIEIINGKNPNLLINNKNVVSLNCIMGESKILLISGPNAGGKTVAMKTIGLFALMAQQGLHIPAEKITIPFFNNILIDIGDRQSIDNDLSTFSAHITNLKFILNNANTDTLIILDELGTGTEPEAGTALSQAILEELLTKNAFVFATTHMSTLKFWAQEKIGIINGGMIFDNKNIKPTFELQLGLPGSSFTLEISNRLGLDKKIIKRAKSLMNKNILTSDTLIEELEQKKQTLKTVEKEINQKNILISKKEHEILIKEKKINQIFSNAKNISLEKAQNDLIKSRREIEQLITNIKLKEASKKSIQKAKIYIEHKLKIVSKKNIINNKKININDIIIGNTVSIPDFDANGIIISTPDNNNNVIVDINSKKIKLHINKIFIEKTRLVIKKESESLSKFNISKPESFKIDLRGQRVDKAIENIKIFLDQTYISGMDFIHIIHGKGTGALQTSIHDELKNINFIKSYNYADSNNGGTGVTIVEYNI